MWAECSLIPGASGVEWVASDLVYETLGSNPAFSSGKEIVSLRSKYRLPVPEHQKKQQQTCISPKPGAKAKRQWGRVGWMFIDHRDGLSSSSFSVWSSIAQSVCQWAFSLLAIWCLRHWVRILHSTQENNLSPSNSNIACARASELTTTCMSPEPGAKANR